MTPIADAESMDHVFYWVGLSSVPGVGRITFRKLLKQYGTPERALAAGTEELRALGWLPDKAIAALSTGSWREHAEQELMKARNAGVQIMLCESDLYPDCLRQTPDPPLFLYVKGSLNQAAGIAVVGTRKPTQYGRGVAGRISSELASAGLTVVSGMARGIDTEAHRGALAVQGRTIAVLGCGIDIAYPPENKKLLQEIAGTGAVVSENPFGTKPEAGYFPARNRIISGLSKGTIVIEAAEDSGSLITAEYTRQQDRPVFAVPGNISSPVSRGANALIKQGALLIENAGDVLKTLGVASGRKRGQEPARLLALLNEEESEAAACITNEPKHIDTIMHDCRTTAAKLSGLLVSLELKGIVKQLPGKFYIREN